MQLSEKTSIVGEYWSQGFDLQETIDLLLDRMWEDEIISIYNTLNKRLLERLQNTTDS